MKVKQPRRWKKHTVQKQGEISNRFSGRILWAMLLLGGIGTLIALGISGGSGTPQNSSRTISDSAFQKVDEKLTAAFPARNLFLRTLTNGIAATGGNRIGDVYFTEERLLECPKQLDAAALSDTADAISQFYAAYQIPTAVIAVPPAGEMICWTRCPIRLSGRQSTAFTRKSAHLSEKLMSTMFSLPPQMTISIIELMQSGAATGHTAFTATPFSVWALHLFPMTSTL